SINRGVGFDVFTDTNHTLARPAATAAVENIAPVAVPTPKAAPAPAPAAPAVPSTAAISVTSSVATAEIEVDGAFVGNTPTTLQLAAGSHRIVVKHGAKMWQRTVQVNGGSTISLNATLQ